MPILLLGGCSVSPPDDALTVDEVVNRIDELDGQIVKIEGWLGECGGLDCGLYPTLEDAKLVADGDWDSKEWLAAMDRRLSVGSRDSFDFWAWFSQFDRVVITGRVDATCRSGKVLCFDRANELEPHNISEIW